MPRKKTGAFAALKKLEADRLALAEREASARIDAATELGEAVLAAKIADLDLAAFRALMRTIARTGIAAASRQLGERSEAGRKPDARNAPPTGEAA